MGLKELREWTRTQRVLYVEDEAKIREETLEFLQRFFEHIVVAQNGREGWEFFEHEPFDLVITDLNMPKMDGGALIQKINTCGRRPCIVIMSGASWDDAKEKPRSDYSLDKPTTMEEWIDVLTKMWKASGG